MSENRRHIHQEILGLAPRLAGIEKRNPFRVPDNFFMGSQEALEFGVSSSEDIASQLNWPKKNPFITPSNYFAVLPKSIWTGIQAAESQSDFIPDSITEIGKKNAFLTPDAYFQNFESRLMKEIQSADLLAAPAENNFKVPEGYFDTFSDRLMQRIQNESEEEIPAVLEGLNQNEGWKVPSGYFDNLSERILDKTIHKEESGGRVIEMPAPGPAKGEGGFQIGRWARYAASAAAMMLLFYVGSFLFDAPTQPTIDINQAIASLSDEELIAYLGDEIEVDQSSLFDLIDFDDIDFLDKETEEFLDLKIIEDMDNALLNDFIL